MTVNRAFVAAVLLFTAIVVQDTIVARLAFLGARADLVLVVLVCIAFTTGPAIGVIFGFAAGLTIDLLSDHPVGLDALVLCIAGYAGGVIRSHFDRLSVVTPMLVVGGISAAASVLFAVVSLLLGDPRVTLDPVVRSVVLSSIYDVVLTPFVYAGVSTLARRTELAARRL